MYRFHLILFLILIFNACQSKLQEEAIPKPEPSALDSIPIDEIPKGLPIFHPEFKDSIQAKLEAEQIRSTISYHKLLQIGRYQDVKVQTEIDLEFGLDSLLESEEQFIQQHQLKNAYETILSQADQYKMIIMTEAHTKPEHRVFASQLLKGLYDKGYRYLGLENILPRINESKSIPFDSTMQERGYPLLSNLSGIYSSEPHYANLIREAAALGMKIFAYERNGPGSERDLMQAEHIIDFQRRHPDGKIICYGGWYHAVEDKIEKWPGSGSYWLAYHYKNFTGDDPLTIYQDAFNEKFNIPSSPYYALFQKELSELDFPQCLIDAKGQNYEGQSLELPFDIVTLTPPIAYNENDLPHWLQWYTLNGEYQMRDLSSYLKDALTYPILVSIREYHASELATPIHCYQLDQQPDGAFELPLKDGWYWLELKDRNGTIQSIELGVF